MAARLPDALRTRLERLGMGFLTPADAFAHLERALLGSRAIHRDRVHGHGARQRRFAADRAATQRNARTRAGGWGGVPPPRVPAQVRSLCVPASVQPRRTVASSFWRDFVREQTVQVLGIARVEDLDVNESLRQFGLDSLMAVELRNVLSRAVEQPLSATLTFDHPTVAALVEHLGAVAFQEELGLSPPAAAAEPVLQVEIAVERPAITNEALEEMSQDDVAAALASRLERMTRGQS